MSRSPTLPEGRKYPRRFTGAGVCTKQEDRQPEKAAGYYRTVARVYRHYYYAALAQERLEQLGQVTPVSFSVLEAMQPESIPELSDDVPEDDPHVVKAKLLANAGLNEYIAPEIQAADGSTSGALSPKPKSLPHTAKRGTLCGC